MTTRIGSINIPNVFKDRNSQTKAYVKLATRSEETFKKDQLNKFTQKDLVKFAKVWFKIDVANLTKINVIRRIRMKVMEKGLSGNTNQLLWKMNFNFGIKFDLKHELPLGTYFKLYKQLYSRNGSTKYLKGEALQAKMIMPDKLTKLKSNLRKDPKVLNKYI